MRRPVRTSAKVPLVVAAVLSAPVPAAAQDWLSAASGKVQLLSLPTSAVTVEISEKSLTVSTRKGELGVDLSSWTFKATADKGQSKLISGGSFTPAFSIDYQSATNHSPIEKDHEHWTGWSVGTELSTEKFADPDGNVPTTYALGSEASIVGRARFGYSFDNGGDGWKRLQFGSALEGRLGVNTPGIRSASEVCVEKSTGLTADGEPLTVTKCEKRALGESEGLALVHFRIDASALRVELPFDTGAPPSVGLLASVAGNWGTFKPRYDAAFGVAVFKPRAENTMLAALLVNAMDISNSAAMDNGFFDRLVVTLQLSLSVAEPPGS